MFTCSGERIACHSCSDFSTGYSSFALDAEPPMTDDELNEV